MRFHDFLYLISLDKEEIIDATRTGGMARFINHCCEPNAYAKILSCPNYHFPGDSGVSTVKELKHIVIMAARNIQVCIVFAVFFVLILSIEHAHRKEKKLPMITNFLLRIQN
jgi:hypothetical protein